MVTGIMNDSNWLKKLRKRIVDRREELDEIADNFGDPLQLARSYIEPFCQNKTPADYSDDGTKMIVGRPVFGLINEFMQPKRELLASRSKQLIVLSDSGMGKTALLVMLKLAHLCSFWPKAYDCKLLRVSTIDLAALENLPKPESTILLLDALDEDPMAVGRIGARFAEVLAITSKFYRTVITCRSQYVVPDLTSSSGQLGRVTVETIQYPTIHLSPFYDHQVDDYLKKRYPYRLSEAIPGPARRKREQAKRLLTMMGSLRLRPFLLAHVDDFMAAESSDWDPDSIYNALVERWLMREQRKLQPSHDDFGSLADGLRQACVLIASHMAQHRTRFVSSKELDSLISNTPALRYLKLIDLGGRSLFSRNSRGDYCFAHYSLQEFFARFDDKNQIYREWEETPSELLKVVSALSAQLLEYLSKHPNVKGSSLRMTFINFYQRSNGDLTP
jgi:hypothetical protein